MAHPALLNMTEPKPNKDKYFATFKFEYFFIFTEYLLFNMSKGVPPKAIPQVQGKYKSSVPMGFSYLPKKKRFERILEKNT